MKLVVMDGMVIVMAGNLTVVIGEVTKMVKSDYGSGKGGEDN